ncbi:MAG: MerR family transcriptional regulator [Flavobacteriales bacterium]|nr:MerR family transcriptional regulator [Flavobacteriales bacterium]MBL0045157.1 MerR family transcriptional regulator [Flavobacteriales bacterium]
MPLKEKTIERIYWTIGEVAEQLGVNTSLLRYWEKEFGMLRPKRTGKGDRLYSKDDVAKIREIQVLLKQDGFTIEGAKAQLRGGRKQEDARDEAVRRLQRVRAELLSLQADLAEDAHDLAASFSR